MLILHTQKAVMVFEEIKEELIYEEQDLVEALSGNMVYYDSVPLPKKRELFFKYLDRHTVSDTVQKLTNSKKIGRKIKMAVELFIMKCFKGVEWLKAVIGHKKYLQLDL